MRRKSLSWLCVLGVGVGVNLFIAGAKHMDYSIKREALINYEIAKKPSCKALEYETIEKK